MRFDGTEAPVKIFIKPLIVWLWIGGSMMAAGTVLAGFPGRRRRVPDRSRLGAASSWSRSVSDPVETDPGVPGRDGRRVAPYIVAGRRSGFGRPVHRAGQWQG